MFNEKEIIAKWNADMYECTETDMSDVKFALSVIGTNPKRILEIACGSGRILVPLAKAGHIVTGLDFDEYMLGKINAKSDGLQNIDWKKADVIKDNWGKDYDVAMLASNFLFNLVAEIDYAKAQALVIQKSANALATGGYIYIDYAYTLHPEIWFGSDKEIVIWEGADSEGNMGKMFLHSNQFDHKTRLLRFVRSFELTLSDGSIIKQDIPSVKHFATLNQVHSWLDSSGFILEEEYGDYNRNPISDGTTRAIIWARKK